jgi:uncharacterized membrane protein
MMLSSWPAQPGDMISSRAGAAPGTGPGAATDPERAGRSGSGTERHPGVRYGRRLPAGERVGDLLCRVGGSWAYLTVLASGVVAAAVVAASGGTRTVALVGLGLSGLAALEVPLGLMAARRAGRIAAEVAAYHLDQGRRAAAVAEEIRAEMGRMHGDLARIAARTDIARGSTPSQAHP